MSMLAWLRGAELAGRDARPRAVLDPAIRAYLEAENAHADAALGGTRAPHDRLFAEMKGRVKEDALRRCPAPDGPYAYFRRYRDGRTASRSSAARRGSAAPRRCCSMPTRSAAGKAFFQPRRLRPCARPSQGDVVVRRSGLRAQCRARARPRDRRRPCRSAAGRLLGAAVWAGDLSALYYVRLDAQHRPTRVFRLPPRHRGGR